MDELEERSLFFSRRLDKSIVSKSFPDLSGRSLRIVSKVVDGQEGLKLAKVNGETILRFTASGRFCVKATFFEDDRRIKTLVLQRFSTRTGPLDRESFSLVGDEIEDFLHFVVGIKTMSLDDTGKMHISDDALRALVLDKTQVAQIFADHESLFLEIAQGENLQRDLISVGYRRKQLERFETLLNDEGVFAAERAAMQTTPEGVWQTFFEANTWIFGYGLSYQFLSTLDKKKLEQVVRGFDVTGPGKRTDGLLKTQGIVKSLCFVEIKRHDTPLLGSSVKGYRSGAWSPSAEVVGGVAQVQATVQEALEQIGRTLEPTEPNGDPTGELLFNVRPKSFLIIGNLAQFETSTGLNQAKVRSFELYRRSTDCPEILTFDELLARARFIVDQAGSAT
ncbi:MAG: Shedu immune nuclease family protein [Janthinobacterium lividum]